MLKASDKTDSHKHEGHWFQQFHHPSRTYTVQNQPTWQRSTLRRCSYLEGFPETRLRVSVTDRAVQAQKERERTQTWETMTGEHSTHGTGEGMDGTIQQSWMPPGVPRTCSAGCAQCWWGSPCKSRGYSQKLISFYIFVPADFDWLMKKGSFSEKFFYSLLQSAITLFHKVLRGQSPINLELQRKAQVSEEGRDPTHSHMGLHSFPNFTGGIPGP